jgi:hypothetical protein
MILTFELWRKKDISPLNFKGFIKQERFHSAIEVEMRPLSINGAITERTV